VTARDRFLKALAGQPLTRPPVWLMRQAGRYLPEYRALRMKHSFLEMAHTPTLAVTATLQPLRRYALDAAIIFSDILVVPEAMGLPFAFREQGGIEMAFRVADRDSLGRLTVSGAAVRLEYVAAALRQARAALPNHALIGFCGAPWTLATYMAGGAGPLTVLWREQRAVFDDLLRGVGAVCGEYVRMQAGAGADAIQIFDSWAGQCPAELYRETAARWLAPLIAAAGDTPVIVFARGVRDWRHLAVSGARCLGVDEHTDLATLRLSLPENIAVQGNLDPLTLTADTATARSAATALLEKMCGARGYIFNLGHGLRPETPPENVSALVATVTGWRDA
jgi:uroporphyrinogen decarboxylase